MPERLYVFFCSRPRLFVRPEWRKPHHWLRDQPCRVFSLVVSVATRSRLTHVALGVEMGDDSAVLECRVWSDRFVAETAYVMHVENLDRVFVIDAPGSAGLQDYRRRWYPRPLLPTVLRWVTGGRTPANDCVTVTSRLLRKAGVDVPPRITSPHELRIWLDGQRYKSVPLRGV